MLSNWYADLKYKSELIEEGDKIIYKDKKWKVTRNNGVVIFLNREGESTIIDFKTLKNTKIIRK